MLWSLSVVSLSLCGLSLCVVSLCVVSLCVVSLSAVSLSLCVFMSLSPLSLWSLSHVSQPAWRAGGKDAHEERVIDEAPPLVGGGRGGG